MREENGPLIALIAFVVLSCVFGVFAWLRHQDLMGDDPSGSKSIKALQDDILKLDREIADYRASAAAYREQIRKQQTTYDFYSDQYTDYSLEYQRRNKLVEWVGGFETQASELSGMVSNKKNETLTRINKEASDIREQMEKTVQARNTDKEAAIARTRQATDEFQVDTKKYRLQKNYEQSGLDESKSVLTDLTQREIERAKVFDEADGRVILSDPVHNLVVIDIGTAAGVKDGYRFECYTPRPGKQRARKGFIEVRHAGVSQSNCMIVERPVSLPRDPLSAYVAQEPEETFSPYQESGRKGFTAQQLTGTPKAAVMGMNKEDPIVEGDLIQNPFFSPGKRLSFYIAGAKEIVNEQQKSAIRYRWTEIKTVVEAHGGKVSQGADTTVNYVIAQKNPKTEGTDAEKAEFQKAVDLGLPVIYEWELFRFLDAK